MVRSFVVKEVGHASEMQLTDAALRKIRRDEILIHNSCVSVSSLDFQHFSGLYEISYPFVPGFQGVGIVERIGSEVDHLDVGDKVCYFINPIGAFSEKRIVNKLEAFKVPNDINEEELSACLMQCMVSEMLFSKAYIVRPKSFVLIPGVTGSVNHILCQMCKLIEAKVIGSVGSQEKVSSAKELGCDHVLRHDQDNFTNEILRITENCGVSVVFDAIGAPMMQNALTGLSFMGMYVPYGEASSKAASISAPSLSSKSLFMTRPSIFHYIKLKYVEKANLIDVIYTALREKKIKPMIGARYKFDEIPQVQHDIENKKIIGSAIAKF